MAPVTVAPIVAVPGGIANVAQAMATADNYIVRNNGRVLLHFEKTGAGAAVVTIITPKTVGGLAVAEQTVAVPATTGDVWAGPFNPDIYNDANGDMDLSTDNDVGMTFEPIQI